MAQTGAQVKRDQVAAAPAAATKSGSTQTNKSMPAGKTFIFPPAGGDVGQSQHHSAAPPHRATSTQATTSARTTAPTQRATLSRVATTPQEETSPQAKSSTRATTSPQTTVPPREATSPSQPSQVTASQTNQDTQAVQTSPDRPDTENLPGEQSVQAGAGQSKVITLTSPERIRTWSSLGWARADLLSNENRRQAIETTLASLREISPRLTPTTAANVFANANTRLPILIPRSRGANDGHLQPLIPYLGTRSEQIEHDHDFLYPTDLVTLVAWLAHLLELTPLDPDRYAQQLLSDWFTQSGGNYHERSLINRHYHQLQTLIDACQTSFTRLKTQASATEDKTVPTPTPSQPSEATAAVAPPLIDRSRSSSEASEADANVDFATSESGHPDSPSLRSESTRLFYVFERNFFGQHGISILGDSQIENLLRTSITQHLREHYSQAQLEALYANPNQRLVALRAIYQSLAQNPTFVGLLRAKYDQHLASLAHNPQASAEFLQATQYDPQQSELILAPNANLTEADPHNLAQEAKIISSLTGVMIDGVQVVNLEKAVSAVALAMGLNETDTPTHHDVISYINSLDEEQFVSLFFADAQGNLNLELFNKFKENPQLLQQIKSLLISSAVPRVINYAHATHARAKEGVLTTGDLTQPPIPETGQAIRAIRAIIPTGKQENEDFAHATLEDSITSRTKLMLADHEKRMRELWLSLDEETQLAAYRAVWKLSDEDPLERLIRESDGSIPFDNGLLSMLRWDEFLRKQHRKRLQNDREKATQLEEQRQAYLSQIEADRLERLARQQEIDATRTTLTANYLEKLTPQEIEQLRRADLIVKVQEAIDYASEVAQRGEAEPDSNEWRLAVDAIRVAQLTVQQQFDVTGELHEQDRKTYQAYLEELGHQAEANYLTLLSMALNEEGQAKSEAWATLVTQLEENQRVASVGALMNENAPSLALPPPEQLANFLAGGEGAPTSLGQIEAFSQVTDAQELGFANLARAEQMRQTMSAAEGGQTEKPSWLEQQRNEAAAIGKGVAEILAEGKGGIHTTLLAAAKKFLTDKEFRDAVVNKTKQALMLGAGTGLGSYLLLQYLAQKLGGAAAIGAGIAGGAATGALVGSLIPGIGTVAGGVIGGIGGGLAGFMAAQNAGASSTLGGGLARPLLGGSEGFGTGFSGASSTTGLTSPVTTGGSPTTPGASLGTGVSPTTAPASSMIGPGGPGAPGAPGSLPAPSATSFTAGASSTPAVVTGATPVAGATSAAAAGAAASVVTLSGAVLVPLASLLALAFLSLYTLFTIYSAFLSPLPIGDNTASPGKVESKYLTLRKTASPATLDNDTQADVTYTITITTKRNYAIKLTALTDSANTAFKFMSGRLVSEKKNPTITPPGPYITLLDFGSDPIIGQKSSSYTVRMADGKNVLVLNTVTITYDVIDAEGNTIKAGQTLTAGASLGIGDHRAACWPTTGNITQIPFEASSYSHRDDDAYDIGAGAGSKIFSPVSGVVTVKSFDASGYGNYVQIRPDGYNFDLIFAHMHSPSVLSSGATVNVGELIGYVGDTGAISTGSHLHYGALPEEPGRSKLNPFLTSHGLTLPNLGDRVYTCYH